LQEVTLFRIVAAILLYASAVYAFETEENIRKSVPVSSATRLVLQAEFGSINIQSGAEKNVNVDVYFRGDPPSRAEFDRMLHDFRLDVTPQGSDVRVNATFVHGWEPMLSSMIDNLFSGNHAICHDWRCLTYSRWLREVAYRITVPQQFDADVSTSGGSIYVGRLKGEVTAHTSGGSLNFDRTEGPVNGSTSGGSITLEGAKGRTVVRTSGGSIHLTDVAGDVDASTSGGSISIEGVSGRVKAHTSGGRIKATEITGAIDASTSGGSITASLIAQPRQDCRFSTSGGSIDVSLASDAHVNLDASTSGGRVSTDFLVPFSGDRHDRELRAPINGGGPLLSLHTSGGGIHVRRAGSL
jgi:hypothetical protein